MQLCVNVCGIGSGGGDDGDECVCVCVCVCMCTLDKVPTWLTGRSKRYAQKPRAHPRDYGEIDHNIFYHCAIC